MDKHQSQLKKDLSAQSKELDRANKRLADLDKLFRKAFEELTPEIVREFIDRIVVYERSKPWKKKNYTQEVEVYFNFVGKV